ncbi:RICIN domain-containing protein [Streptomyces sp. NPDC013181]|uniref:RICIN domain-containing protein n=1 Tax=Streptomyces sp. NPDC013181 TaxID=3364864 RepID=UPI0036A6A7D9
MSELPKRNVTRPAGPRPTEPPWGDDAAKLESARAALARVIAAQRAEEEGAGGGGAADAPEPAAEPAHGAAPADAPRRRGIPRRVRVAAAVVGVVVVAVVASVIIAAGGGSDGGERRAETPAEGSVRPEDGREGAGSEVPLPGGPTADRTVSPSATSSTSASPSSGQEPRSTPGAGGSTASAKSGPSSDTAGGRKDGDAKPGGGADGDSTGARAVPLAVEAGGKCLTGAGSGAQLLASACDGSSGQAWTAGSDGTLRLGGLCAAVTGTEDRTPIVLAACDRSPAQRIGLSGKELRSASTGKCLDLFGGASGSQIVLWECNGRDNQRWSAV